MISYSGKELSVFDMTNVLAFSKMDGVMPTVWRDFEA